MSSQLVSVIIPVFNREAILDRAVTSVLEQSFTDFELLLIDDHSTDGSMCAMQGLAERDPRIRVMTNARTKGVSGARNTGLDEARGDYVAFLDSDDAWETDCLARLKEGFSRINGPLDVVTAVRTPIDSVKGNTLAPEYIDLKAFAVEPVGGGFRKLGGDLFTVSLGQRVITLCCALFRREAIGGTRFDEGLYQNEDSMFHQELLFAGARVAYLDESLLRYYVHETNSSLVARNQRDDLVKLERATLGRIRYLERSIKRFDLKGAERAKRQREISSSYYWIIAQNCCLGASRRADFIKFTVKALRYSARPKIFFSAGKNLILGKV